MNKYFLLSVFLLGRCCQMFSSQNSMGNPYRTQVNNPSTFGVNKLNKLIEEGLDPEIAQQKGGFQENKGQMLDMDGKPVPSVLFASGTKYCSVFITEKGLTYLFLKFEDERHEEKEEKEEKHEAEWVRIDMDLKGAKITRNNITKVGESSDFFQYFKENCPNGVSARNYQELVISEIYPGIDWVLYNSSEKGFKYDFIVHPGADPKQIRMLYLSRKQLHFQNDGSILLKNKLGSLIENAPFSYLKENQKAIKSKFELVEEKRKNNHYETTLEFSFDSETDFSKSTLVIDPQLVWSTLYGGNGTFSFSSGGGFEGSRSITTDNSGNLFIVGYTASSSVPFPTQNSGGYFQGVYGGGYNDVFILKFNNSGVRLWSTYYGGSGADIANSVAIDASGNVFITGNTRSTNFPVQNAGSYFDGTFAGVQDIFFLKFNNSGTRLWATYYGINSAFNKDAYSATTDLSGNVYFAVQNNIPELIKFSNSGNLLWTQNSGLPMLVSLATDAMGNIFATGSISGMFSTPTIPSCGSCPGYTQAFGGGVTDAVVMKFSSAGSILMSTFYGGNGLDAGVSIATDGNNDFFVVGYTGSSNFPVYTNTVNGSYFDNTLGGTQDAFILKFSNTGTRLWATLFGGSGTDFNFAVDQTYDYLALDVCGNAYMSFETNSSNINAQSSGAGCGGFNDNSYNGSTNDVFITKFSNTGKLNWASYLGGNGQDFRAPLATDNSNNLFISGESVGTANSFPFVNPGGGAYFDNNQNQQAEDLYIMKFVPIPPTYTQTQTNPSSCTCNGVATISVTCGEAPYNYYWSNSVTVNNSTLTSNSINGLCPGVYQVTVTSNCNYTYTTSYTLTGSTNTIMANILSFNPTCTSPTGSVVINSVTNGVPNYTITEGTSTLATNVNVPYTITNVSVGTHTYVVTSANGCSTTFTANIAPNAGQPNIATTGPYTLTCSNTTVNAIATTTTSGSLTYTWSGPGILSGANTLTATINQPGNYTIQITQGACTSSAIVSVVQNTIAPVVSAIATNALNCGFSSAIVTATSATNPLNYQWVSGPNTFSQTVNLPGNYTVIATNAVNGCTTGAVVAVAQNTVTPAINIVNQPTLNCLATTAVLQGTSTTTGVTYQWLAGPASSTYSVSAPGNYTLTVTDPNNGCTSQTIVAVNQNTTVPNLSATASNSLNCLATTATLNGNSTTSGVTYSWSPPNVTTNTAVATTAGNYSLIVINPSNGCTNQAVVSVNQNTTAPNISATVPNTLTCLITSVTLTGNSTTSGATFTWIPQSVNTNTASATTAGNYTFTVTDPSNGCTSQTIVTVIQNGSFPNISINVPAILNCTNTSVTLQGNSTTSGATFTWLPQNVNTNTAVANSAGNYSLTVTNPLNGCTSQSVVPVNQNTTSPNISASVSNTLTCLIASVTLTGNSTTSGATFTWAPQNVSTNTAAATNAGNYTLTVTDPSNGCTSQTVVAVNQNTTAPNISSTVPNTLTCLTTSITLTGNSTTSGVSYSWSPQNVTTSTAAATNAGNYTLAVTDPNNGCTSQTVVAVNQNTTAPNISSTVSNTLTCLITSVTLTGNSTTSGATFTWIPQSVNTNTASATTAGNYTFTVTDPSNGCTSQTIVTVIQNGSFPNISINVPAVLNCTNTSVTLQGNSTTSGVTYSWSPQNVTTQNAVATIAGNYTFTVIDPVNGCSSQSIVSVTQNTIAPIINAVSSNSLNCNLTTSTLTANSSNTSVVFVWNGGSLSNAVNPSVVSAAGNYSVTATDPTNGCTGTSVVAVLQNTAQPNLTINSSGNLSCNTTSVTLSGNSTTAGLTYSWAPINLSTQNIVVNTGGTYSLTVTNPLNGCKSTATVGVTSSPMFTANITVLSQINCFGDNTGALQLNNLGGGTAPFSITNLNTNNTIGNVTSFPISLNNLAAGNYSIEVADVNGCKQLLYSSIHQPGQLITNIAGNTTLCQGQTANITSTVSGGTSPYMFAWSPASSANPSIAITPTANISLTLTVTDNNGCKAQSQIALIVNPQPNTSLVNNKLIGCAPVCASFSLAQGQQTGNSYLWNFSSIIPTSTTVISNLENPDICFTTEGVYSASITIITVHGCSATVNYSNLVTVHSKPTANFYFSPERPDIVEHPNVEFTNTSTNASAYQWYYVNTMFSSQTNPNYVFSDPGKFLVTLIASNGPCSDTLSKVITVEDDIFLYIPNTFTPNDDGLNDFFYPVLTGNFSEKNYSFEIFDRWGELLYRSNNPFETKWNGYYKTELCKDDTYTWKLNFTNNKGKTKTLTGHVVLMK